MKRLDLIVWDGIVEDLPVSPPFNWRGEERTCGGEESIWLDESERGEWAGENR